MKYEGSVPNGYKAFTIIYMVTSNSMTNLMGNTGLVKEQTEKLIPAFLFDFSSLFIFIIFYICLYNILKERFVDYFFKLYIPTSVISFFVTMGYSFSIMYLKMKGFQSGALTFKDISSGSGYEALPFIHVILDPILMSIPLIWTLKKSEPDLTETAS